MPKFLILLFFSTDFDLKSSTLYSVAVCVKKNTQKDFFSLCSFYNLFSFVEHFSFALIHFCVEKCGPEKQAHFRKRYLLWS